MHLLHVVAEYVLASTIATFRTGNRMGRVKLDGILLIRVRTWEFYAKRMVGRV